MSRGRKVRHACSVIGVWQYREMESSSASAPPAREPVNIEAAGEWRSRKLRLLTHSWPRRQEGSRCVVDAAFRAVQLKVAVTRWLRLHQKEGLYQEEKITTRI